METSGQGAGLKSVKAITSAGSNWIFVIEHMGSVLVTDRSFQIDIYLYI